MPDPGGTPETSVLEENDKPADSSESSKFPKRLSDEVNNSKKRV